MPTSDGRRCSVSPDANLKGETLFRLTQANLRRETVFCLA
jgi:hypothetical protein